MQIYPIFMPKIEDVTIIIVAYKSAHIIKDCLDGIVGSGAKIIVIDNGSGDNIRELLQQNYPDSGIELMFLEYNCGFGKANNAALEKIDTEFAFLLNPDAKTTAESIANLIKISDANKDVAIATALDTKDLNPSKKTIKISIDRQKSEFEHYAENDDFLEMNFVSGGYMLLKMEVFRKIGFFDNNIFLYGEDDELCSRSLANGYKNILVKSSFVNHISYQATKTVGVIDEYRLLFFRNWHMGWSKTYLKRKNKNYLKVFAKALMRFTSTPAYFIKYDKKTAITKTAIAMGSMSNLIGIDCFNDKNRVAKVKEVVRI